MAVQNLQIIAPKAVQQRSTLAQRRYLFLATVAFALFFRAFGSFWLEKS